MAISQAEQRTLDTLLAEAIAALDIDRAKIYTRKGANVNLELENVRETINRNGNSYTSDGKAALFHQMIERNFNRAAADFLIEQGVDVDVKNFNGNTGLMLAVKNAQLDRVKYFLSKSADPLATNKQGQMVLDQAQALFTGNSNRQPIIDALVAALDDVPKAGGSLTATVNAAAEKTATTTTHPLKPIKTVSFGKPKKDFEL